MSKFTNKFPLHRINFNIVTVFLSALILRLFLANFGTLQLDHGTFVSWANSLAEFGFKNFYAGWSDYLPGYLYILWVLGKINLVFPTLQALTFKIPAILADLFTGLIIYQVVKNKKSLSAKAKQKWGLGLFAFYVFNPAVIANSTLWGQVDSLTALFSLFSIYIFPISYPLSAITLSVGTLIKPQAAFVAPAILYLFVVNNKKFTDLFVYCLTGLLIFIVGFLPFTNISNLFSFIFERLSLSASQYPYGSVNAFSFWGLFGFWKPDTIISWIGVGLVVVINIFIFVKLIKRKNSEYLIATISLLTTFLFLTRMHERHLLPVLSFILLSSLEILPLLLIYFGLSLTYIANLAYAYYWITDNFKEIFNPVMVKSFIIGNLLLFITFLSSLYSKKVNDFSKKFLNFKLKKQTSKTKLFETKDFGNKKTKLLLIIILLFSFVTRFYNLGNPQKEYFDEVYHVFTAKLMLHSDPKAWEWWNPHPEGFAYEWTHPPLAKLGMVVGMAVFGENSFGSRSIQAFLGTFCVYLIYLITLTLFKDRKMALFSSLLLSVEGLFLVMNRIGMNDTFVLFFMLLSYLLFLKDKNFFSAISLGLALASKWSAIYFLPILAITFLVLRKKIKPSLFWFVILPPLVYLASYTQMFTTGHSWSQFIEVQKQMWWYHTNLDAQHPYTSPAWSWPILFRPIYLYNGPETNGWVERIYAFGNPAVFWFGLYALIVATIISWKEKIKKLGLMVFSYLVLFVPWMASPRIMFLYHYLPSIPFLVILSAFVLRRYAKLTTYYLLLATVVFIYFYPHWSGIRIPEGLDKSYYWFSSWR